MKGRIAIAALTLSAAGLIGIAGREGYTDVAVQPVPGDAWTNGFGSTTDEAGKPLRPGEKTDPVRALQRAGRDVSMKESVLKRCIAADLYPHEYDAFVDLAYNVGPAAVCRSSIPAKLAAGDYEAACRTILDFRKVQGRDCSLPENHRFCGGVWTRRQAMTRLCLTGERS